ncbi:MAG: peptidoglycan DD-metalloendopeptidase family protein [Burkholderiales bacterium]|nr:peptidoglycan DD-metalloendopeptidase family protein [Burkholderiales bacterium]
MIVLFLAAGEAASAQDLCSNYQSRVNCVGKKRPVHNGIDFGGVAGTEVISATHGTFVRRTFDECSGHGITVRTDFTARDAIGEGPVYVRYAHVEAYPNYKSGRQLSPGDPLGTTIPLRRTPCHASREHVHYELRIDADPKRHIDPHAYWADGPAKVTCYRNGMTVPPGKAVAPIRCAP